MNMPTLIKRWFYTIVLLPCIAVGQLTDDFSDGDFTFNPAWGGDTQAFQVNSSYQLQLDDNGEGSASLFTPMQLFDEMEWRCWSRLSFSPSGNNYARIYLSAIDDPLGGFPDGLFIMLGEAGSNDAVRLMLQVGGDTSTLIRGVPGAISSSFSCSLKVLHINDTLRLFTDYDGGQNFQEEGYGIWHPVPGTQHLGLYCKYTSSNSQKFYFDDFYAGPQLFDTIAPYEPERYDLVINEIMADPSPPVQLPEFEYLELYNTTALPFDLSGWTLIVGASEKDLTGAYIAPEGYLILGKDEAAGEMGIHGNYFGLESFSLTNAGQELMLIDDHAKLISALYYSKDWYRNEERAEGGWSIEQINPYNPCPGPDNWVASNNYNGGSPGALNSVFDDFAVKPEIINVCTIDSVRIRIELNQSLHQDITLDPGIFSIDHGAGPIQAILPEDPWFTTFILYPESPLLAGLIYELSIHADILDCTGDTMLLSEKKSLGLPQRVEKYDLVINEVLFNPFPGGGDYVEIMNRSGKVISFSGLSIASVKHNPPAPPDTSITTINDGCKQILPGEYVLLCEDFNKVDRFYYCIEAGNYLEPDGFPAYNNDAGLILLQDDALNIIDVFCYQEDMHYPLLNVVEGVALERLHPDRPTYDPTNWHSASQSSGFGTPGYLNSQFSALGNSVDPISISPKICKPGTDGEQGHIGIHYAFDRVGYLGNIMIFNSNGQLIRQLVNNELLGSSGTYSWNGITDNNTRAPSGVYVILIELTGTNSRVIRYKKTGVIAAQ